MSGQHYDHLAPVYRMLESALFGRSLARARVRHLLALRDARRVLVVGEGDGRFLEGLLRANPHCRVDCVEASLGMLEQVRRRVARLGALERVHLIRADARRYRFAERAYDTLVSHFFFDILEPAEIAELIPRLAAALEPDGRWAVADFHLPERGLSRLRSCLWLRLLYAFFRWQAGVAASELVDVTPLVKAEGFALERDSLLRGGLLRSQLFVKRAAVPPPGAAVLNSHDS